MRNRAWICSVLFILSAFLIIAPAYGDVCWESVVESQGLPKGLPPDMPKEALKQFNKTEVSKNYASAHASRTDTGDSVTIMDFEGMVLYHLNTRDKTYTRMDMKSVAQAPEMQAMMKGMMDSIQITPTDEVKEIAGYKCKKYLVNMMMTQGEYWVSKDVNAYEQLMDIGRKMQAFMEKNPMLRQMNVAGMMARLEGFPVQTVMKVMGMTTVTTLKQIEEKPLDKSLFKVPEGYKVREMPSARGSE